MRRVILGVLGALLILGGAAAAFSGAVLVGAFGPDGRVDSPSIRLTTGASALSSDVARIDADLPQGIELAQIHLSATSLEGQEVFIGVGPAREVLSYLAGSPYDVVTGIDGRTDTVELRRVSGTGTPPPPTSESFWVAQSYGAGKQTLDWKIASGRYLFVIMNADGTAGVDVQARAGVSAPWVFGAGLAALIVGLLVVILGAICLAVGFRTPRKSIEAPVYADPLPPVVPAFAAPSNVTATTASTTVAPAPDIDQPAQDQSADAALETPPEADPQAPPREPGSAAST